MSYSVYIQRRASEDIRSAMDYYNSKQSGLGEKFLSTIDKHFISISRNLVFQLGMKM